MQIPLLQNFILCGGCTIGAAITDITQGQSQRVGQIQKIIFQRKKDGAADNSVAVADAPLLATWTSLKVAIDSTKVSVTDFIGAPTNTPGEERTFGGGNATKDGIPIVLGVDNSVFECQFYDIAQSTIAELKALSCEDLGVYFVDECSVIWGAADDPTTPTLYKPVDIFSLFVSDKNFGGYESADVNTMRFRMAPNWSDNLAPIIPTDFDKNDI